MPDRIARTPKRNPMPTRPQARRVLIVVRQAGGGPHAVPVATRGR